MSGFMKGGYAYSKMEDHHFANSLGYVLEHRLVWERHNNAILLPWADVHHINEVKTDNKPKNLNAMMHGQHSTYHNIGNQYKKKDMSSRQCCDCSRKYTRLRKGKYYDWYSAPNGFRCFWCYNTIRKRNKRRERKIADVQKF